MRPQLQPKKTKGVLAIIIAAKGVLDPIHYYMTLTGDKMHRIWPHTHLILNISSYVILYR